MARSVLKYIAVLFTLTICVAAQEGTAKFKVQIVLIDKELNQKPVPKFTINVRRLDGSSSEAIPVKTGLDGFAEVELTPGRYQLKTPRPVEFHGKQYAWEMEISVEQGQKTLELTNDNAKITEATPEPPARIKDELTASFKRYQTSVVTVWSEFGRGTGFIIDSKGLVMTNQHVIGPSDYIAVQFDEKRKVTARVLVSDSQKDVAILWVNLEALPDATVAPLAKTDGAEPLVVEGERVFTIGSPLNQRKVMTTGIVSKVEAHAIISDININHGNSGGPLFNSLGEVVGITTFGDPGRQGGPGISGIVRIEETLPMLAQARAELIDRVKPDPVLLPVEPTTPFPVEAIKESLMKEKLNPDPYIFDMGDYSVAIMIPIFKYHLILESEMRAAREKNRRNKKDTAIKGTFQPLDDLKQWAEYTGEYKPVIQIRATPHLGESFWGAVGRNMAGGYGLRVPARLRYKTDLCESVVENEEKESNCQFSPTMNHQRVS